MRHVFCTNWLKSIVRKATQIWLIALCGLVVAGAVQADEFEARKAKFSSLCNSLERSQVDCACVGKRLATFLHVSPNEAFEQMIEADYKVSLGIRADRAGAIEAAMGTDNKTFDIIAAYDPYGGYSIAYEEGCVIAGAAPTPIASYPQGAAYQNYYASCEASVGTARYCQCETAARAKVLTPEEFEANYLSFSDYSGEDGTMEGLAKMRAARMGISVSAYKALTQRAAGKLDAEKDDDGSFYFSNRCHALTYGEDGRSGRILSNMARSEAERAGPPVGLEAIDVTRPAPRPQTGAEMMAGIEAEQRAAAGFAASQAPGVQAEAAEAMRDPRLAALQDDAAPSSAQAVLERGCLSENSGAYCACLAEGFERAVPAGLSEGGKRMAAMMLVGSGLPEMEAAQIAMNATPSEQNEAAMAFSSLISVPGQCEGR